MTWAALLAAALGGGIVASLLEAWFANLRAYETARLLVRSELTAMAVMSESLRTTREVPADLRATVHYPTDAWRANGAKLAMRLERRGGGVFRALSSFYTFIDGFPAQGQPLTGPSAQQLDALRKALATATLNVFGEAVVYGPIAAVKRYRRRRRRLPATGAQPGAQDS